MEEIDIKICLKKINKDIKDTKKIIAKQKNRHKTFLFFFFIQYKNGKKS